MRKILISLWIISSTALLWAGAPKFNDFNVKDTLYEDVGFEKTLTVSDPESDSAWLEILEGPFSVKDSIVNDSVFILKWSPEQTDVGIHSIIVKVEDTEGLADTIHLEWVVLWTNDPPEFAKESVTADLLEDSLYEVKVGYSDIDDQSSFDLKSIDLPINSQARVVEGEDSVEFSWVPDNSQIGLHEFMLVIEDDSLAADTLALSLTVKNTNDPPVAGMFQQPVNQGVFRYDKMKIIITAGEDEDPEDHLYYRFYLSYQDSLFKDEELYYRSDWIADDNSIVVYQFDSPQLIEDIWYYVTVEMKDDSGAVVRYDTVKTFVNTINARPVVEILSPKNDAIIDSLTPLLEHGKAEDTDDSVFYYDLNVLSDNDSVVFFRDSSEDTVYQFIDSLEENGSYHWRVRAFDTKDDSSEWTPWAYFHINTEEEPPNPPLNFTIVGLDDKGMINVLNPTFIWEHHTVPDPDPLTGVEDLFYEIELSEDTLAPSLEVISTELNSEYYLYRAGDLEELKLYYVRIRAVDPTGLKSLHSQWVQFTIDVDNSIQEIVSAPPDVAYEDKYYRYRLMVYDEERDPLEIGFLEKPAGMRLDSATIDYATDTMKVDVIWKPDMNDIGTHQVEIAVTDPEKRMDRQTFQLEVKNTNDPPVQVYPPVDTIIRAREGDLTDMTLISFDEDEGDTLIYNFTDKPSWLSIEEESRDGKNFLCRLRGTPGENDIGENIVRYKVMDDSSALYAGRFTLLVVKRNSPPSAPLLLEPADGAVISDGYRPVLKIRKSEDFDPEDSLLNYKIELSLHSDFESIEISKEINQTDFDTIVWELSTDLEENNRYFWRSKAFDSHSSESEASEVFDFFINNNDDPPDLKPEHLKPKNNNVVHDNNQLIFSFNNPHDPDTELDDLQGKISVYYLNNQVFTSEEFDFDQTRDATHVDLSKPFKDQLSIVENDRFYWIVGVKDASHDYIWSKADSFWVSLTDEAPNVPDSFSIRLSPFEPVEADGFLETDQKYAYLEWKFNGAPDPDDSEENTSYVFYIRDFINNEFIDTLESKPGVGLISTISENLDSDGFSPEDDGVYQIYVAAKDRNGKQSPWNGPVVFNYNKDNNQPEQPKKISVENYNENTKVLNDTVLRFVFGLERDKDYTDSIETLQYEIEFSEGEDFQQIYYRKNDIEYDNLKLIDKSNNNYYFRYEVDEVFDNYSAYYFRFRAKDDGGLTSHWMETVYFETRAGNRPPDKPVILYPPEDSFVVENVAEPDFITRKTGDEDGDEVYFRFFIEEWDEADFVIKDSSAPVNDTVWKAPQPLTENGIFRLRVKSLDSKMLEERDVYGLALEDTVVFAVSKTAEPPSAPVIFGLKDRFENNGLWYVNNRTPIFIWNPSFDPDPFEQDSVRYEIWLKERGGSERNEITDYGVVEYEIPENNQLEEDGFYLAKIRALGKDLNSGWGLDTIEFMVNSQPESPNIKLLGELTEADKVFKGNILIEWEAKDSDGDSIFIRIEYSGDNGLSWRALEGFDSQGGPMENNDGEYSWNCNGDFVNYGDKRSLIKVIASDKKSPDSQALSQPFTIAKSFGAQPKMFSPGDETTRLNFSLKKVPSKVTIKIYNTSRRLIRTLIDNEFVNQKEDFVEWDGKDDNGKIVPNRVYYIVIDKEGESTEYSSVVVMKK